MILFVVDRTERKFFKEPVRFGNQLLWGVSAFVRLAGF